MVPLNVFEKKKHITTEEAIFIRCNNYLCFNLVNKFLITKQNHFFSLRDLTLKKCVESNKTMIYELQGVQQFKIFIQVFFL